MTESDALRTLNTEMAGKGPDIILLDGRQNHILNKDY